MKGLFLLVLVGWCYQLTAKSFQLKWLFLLVLLAWWVVPCAAQAPPLATYTDARVRYQLAYPPTWQVREPADGTTTTFSAGSGRRPAPAVVTLAVAPLPDREKDWKPTAHGAQDSLWRRILRLPDAQVLRIDQYDAGRYDEVRYDYTYLAATGSRTHVVGRTVWRGGYAFHLEYRAGATQDEPYLAEGRQLLDSFAFTTQPFASRRYADQVCDNKLYGIAAYRRHNGQVLDDCQTIHEFSTTAPTDAPIVHARVLPFQSYALAKGFDNCLYSVTKAPTDTPEYVYRYDPATRQGRYTTWQLPAQGPDNSWISGGTDDRGLLYFLTADGCLLVKINPADGAVTVIWSADPVQKAPYYPSIGFAGAGSHANFCLDDADTMYRVYSTDGSLLKVNLRTQQPYPERMYLQGLPKRGGYSDVLLQNDETGQRRFYLAGPKAVYRLDLAHRRASLVRQGTYTDLAGCNLFRVVPHSAPAPPPPATATWRGRVLDATTYHPLPEAQVRIGATGAETAVPLTPGATFTYTAKPGSRSAVHAQLAGYFAADSGWTAAPGSHVQDLLLRPLAVGTTLPLDNVQFEQGKAVFLASSFAALDQLVALLTTNPPINIELHGHTDNVGSPEKNVVLSEQRARAVKAYLINHGVAADRVTTIGFGGTKPIASNGQESTRQRNRRVEFRVTSVQ